MNPLVLVAGLVYALLFWAVCATRPPIALLLIVAAAPFQNDISGGGPVRFSLAEINLLLSLPLTLLSGRRLHLGSTFAPAMFYIAVCLVCSSFQWRASTMTSMIQIVIYFVVVVFVFATLARTWEDYRVALHGMLAVCLFLAVSIMVHRSQYIYGLHKNGVGSSLAAAFVIAFTFWLGEGRPKARWAYAVVSAILALGMIVTLSRGSWLGAAVGVLVVMGLRREFKLMLRTGLVMMPVIAIGWFSLPAESREYATGFSADRVNVQARYNNISVAKEVFRASPVFGAGVGIRKEIDATNIFYITLAETGVMGVVAVACVQLAVVVMVWRAHRILPARSLGFALVAMAGALTLGKLTHGMVDHYWGRGSLTVAWAAVGMASRVAYDQRKWQRQAKRAKRSARLEEQRHVPQSAAASFSAQTISPL